jgi:hypothetical protein
MTLCRAARGRTTRARDARRGSDAVRLPARQKDRLCCSTTLSVKRAFRSRRGSAFTRGGFSFGGCAATQSAAARVPAAASSGIAPKDLRIGPRRYATALSVNSPRAIRKRGRCAPNWRRGSSGSGEAWRATDGRPNRWRCRKVRCRRERRRRRPGRRGKEVWRGRGSRPAWKGRLRRRCRRGRAAWRLRSRAGPARST